MQCEEIQLELTAFLQGGLPPDQRAAVERHLSTCQTCSEEAAVMRDLSRTLSKGLREWVELGTCPPELLQSLEQNLRSQTRRANAAWWRNWQVYAGAVAAAAVLIVVLTRGMDVSHQIASLPLVGTLAAQLLYPDSDVEGELPKGAEASDEHDGIVMAVHKVITGPDAIRVEYTLRGELLDTQANVNRFQAQLTGPKGLLKIRRLHIVRAADGVLLKAEYEPVLPGQALSLKLPGAPLKESAPESARSATWSIQFKS